MHSFLSFLVFFFGCKLKPNPKFHHEASYWCVCHHSVAHDIYCMDFSFTKEQQMTKAGQQQRKREEAGAGDSLQLLEGKLEW